MHRTTPFGLLAISNLLLLCAACDKPSYIELSPSRLELERRGQIQRISGKAMNHQGRYFPEIMFDWESENPSVATVDDRGNVKAVANGRTSIIARHRNIEARARVSVVLAERIELEETEITISLTGRRRHVPRATVFNAEGEPMPERHVAYTSGDTDILGIDPLGGLHPQSPGETRIIAEVDGLTGIINVTVAK